VTVEGVEVPDPVPSLVQRAATLLREGGEVGTGELAQRVLGLSGHPGAAAAAVFTLLGSDPRFRVDAHGFWRLDESLSPVGASLAGQEYAVVDVETTGGVPARGHRIIEVAVVEVRLGVVAGEFRTLVNPGRGIPPGVTRLTGITDAGVRDAPYFDEIAGELLDRLRGRVFVAHNAPFDWGFVSSQLAESTGEIPGVALLCTVRLARRLLPHLPRRNLDALAEHFGIPIQGRHRAYGDALATARILLRLLDEAGGRGIPDLAGLLAFLEGTGRDRGRGKVRRQSGPRAGDGDAA